MYYNEGMDKSSLPQLIKALDKNVTKLYELYLYHLVFLDELGRFVERYEDQVKTRYIQNEKENRNTNKLLTSAVLQRLMASETLEKAKQKYSVQWQGDDDILRRIFLDLKNQDVYTEYLQFSDQNRMLEQEVLLFILKHYPANFSILQQHIEEHFYNWHDDRKIALQMASKTIQVMASKPEDETYVQPVSQNEEETIDFGNELIRATVTNEEKITGMIAQKITKWEPHQIAMVDSIILKMAVSEFLHFPGIPAKVSINEYIELAKNYSTPQSKKFVNGVLDAILQDLRKQGSALVS